MVCAPVNYIKVIPVKGRVINTLDLVNLTMVI